MEEEWVRGYTERVTFHSDESGFSVLKIKTSHHRDLVTVTGSCGAIFAGEYIEAKGIWLNDKKFGKQFKANVINAIQPTSLEGIQRYLGSGLIKGIGPAFAKVLIEGFKERIFDVIENESERLLALPGIGEKRVQMITKAWGEQKYIREIMLYLHSHSIGTARAYRIYKTYGEKSIEIIENNPYCLANDIRGIGFKTADTLAMSIGIEHNSIKRAQAGVIHVTQELSSEGHCAIFEKTLIEKSSEILEIDGSIIEAAIRAEIDENRLISDTIDEVKVIYVAWLFHAERAIAQHLYRLSNTNINYSCSNLETLIKNAEEQNNITLSETQKKAVELAVSSKVCCITGGPGVGKTTIVKTILTILKDQKLKISLTAPTGRAAKRLFESTHIEAKTIHRLLAFDPKTGKFSHDQENPLGIDLLVVDEASMVDVQLMASLLKALPDNATLIIVGDIDQLPSVGPGKVLADIIHSGMIKTVRLTEIFRQTKTSEIIINAHRINRGELPKDENLPNSDFFMMYCNDIETIQEKILTLISERIPRVFKYNPIEEIQVLAPMNRGALGVNTLNDLLQKRLNPSPSTSVTKYGTTFSVGDKVIQTVNNYDKDVFNGDIGFIKSIDLDRSEVEIWFDEKKVNYDVSELDELELAYAISIHKSQGSEYPVVIIPVAMQHYMLLQRNLIYTGVTRGKKIVILIGEKKAVNFAVRNLKENLRITKLAQRIIDSFNVKS